MINTSEISKLSLKEMIDFITTTYHKPLKKIIPEIKLQFEEIEHYPEKFDLQNFWIIKELFSQFESELLNHVSREEHKFYSEIIKLEKKQRINKKFIKEFLDLQKIEHSEIDNYLYSIKKFISKLHKNNIKASIWNFEELKDLFHTLYLELSECIYVENVIFNLKIEELYDLYE